jgi:hypothetical protein
MKFFLLSFFISGMSIGLVHSSKAEVQDKNMDWMQEVRNQEIPVEEKIPVQEPPTEKEAGMSNTIPNSTQKNEIKSFDPFASDKPDVQSSHNQWQQSQKTAASIRIQKPSTLNPEEKQIKPEENQTSILSFNLMLNWLNRFKSNQDMF